MTSNASPTELVAATKVSRWLKRAPVRALLELASRFGYVARALVYLSLGVIALFAALDLTRTAKGPADAVAAFAAWPLGQVLMGVIALGLVGFAGWRALQSVFDADGHGTSAKGLAVRTGQALSGIVHAGLALSIMQAMDGLAELAEGDPGASEAVAQALLSVVHGDLVLIVLGAAVFLMGLANIGQAMFQDFAKRLACEGAFCDWAVGFARFGYIGRAIAFAPVGLFLMEAGLDAHAEKARSLGETLQGLESQPFGSLLLSIAGLGLIAFGIFALIEARFRRMHVPKISIAPS